MEIEVNIIQRVKGFLKITEDISSVELRNLLEVHRNYFHPDKFEDDEAKKEAETKFKEAANLLSELKRHIEHEMLQMGAKEIAVFKPLYDHAATQNELEKATERISVLEHEVEKAKKEKQVLMESLSDKRKEEIREEIQRLKALYKPSRAKMFSMAAIVAVSGAIALMTKVESIHGILEKYSPISKSGLDAGVFIVFIGILLLLAKQIIESHLVNLKIGEVCSVGFSKSFMEYLDERKEWQEGKGKYFSENDVFEFIRGRRGLLDKLLAFAGIKLYRTETIDKLKDFFIAHLLGKELIEVSQADRLDRKFKILEAGAYRYSDIAHLLNF
jgi:hypothetical protein